MKRKIMSVTLSLTLIFGSLLLNSNMRTSASALIRDDSMFSFDENSSDNVLSENDWSSMPQFYENNDYNDGSLLDENDWNNISNYDIDGTKVFSYVDFSPFIDSDGSLSDPYIISTAAQLAAVSVLSNNCNSCKKLRDGNNNELQGLDFTNCYLEINDNINISDHYWTPIGKNHFFNGTIEFNGYTVDGLNLRVQNESNYEFLGLFGKSKGEIYNLNMGPSCNINCTADYICFGGIVACNLGVIRNCTSKLEASINGRTQAIAGGIVGFNSGKGCVSSCNNKGEVSAASLDYEIAGGIVGVLAKGSVRHCENKGKVVGDNFYSPEDGKVFSSSKKSHVGGIVGEKAEENARIIACINKGNLDYLPAIDGIRCGEILGCGSSSGVVNCSYLTRSEYERLFVYSGVKCLTVTGIGSNPGFDVEGAIRAI